MKIAFLSVFHPFRGGISQFSTSLFLALSDKTAVRAYNFKRQYPKLFFPGKTQFVSPDKENPFENKQILDSVNPVSFRKTAQEINAFSPDLLLTNYWLPFFAPALGGVAKRMHSKCKKVSILHNVIPHETRPFDRSFTRTFLNKNDGFVVLSEKVKNDLIKLKPDSKYLFRKHPLYDHFGEKQDRDTSRQALGIPFDKKVLLFFGFIRRYKGLDILLEAFRRLSKDYHLIIAGECYENFDNYQSIIDRYQLSDRITLKLNYIPQVEVGNIFSASDLVILPYRSATQSGITPVAYHFDKPVLTTDVGGLAEYIVNGKTGWVIQSIKPLDLSQQIQSLFPLPDHVESEIQNLKQELSWDRFANQILNFAASI